MMCLNETNTLVPFWSLYILYLSRVIDMNVKVTLGNLELPFNYQVTR